MWVIQVGLLGGLLGIVLTSSSLQLSYFREKALVFWGRGFLRG